MTLQLSACNNHQLQQRTILLVEDEPFVRDATGAFWSVRVLPYFQPRTHARPSQFMNNASNASIWS
jgi:hypothetical protein